MRDNPEGGESNPAENVCRPYKKNSPSVLSCIDKKTKKGCGYSSEVGTFHNGRNEQGSVPLRKSGRRQSCGKELKERARSKVITPRNLWAELNERGVPVKVSRG